MPAQEIHVKSSILHKPTYFSFGPMIDGVRCSCGWKSPPFFDGYEYAMHEWREHVAREEAWEKQQKEIVEKM